MQIRSNPSQQSRCRVLLSLRVFQLGSFCFLKTHRVGRRLGEFASSILCHRRCRSSSKPIPFCALRVSFLKGGRKHFNPKRRQACALQNSGGELLSHRRGWETKTGFEMRAPTTSRRHNGDSKALGFLLHESQTPFFDHVHYLVMGGFQGSAEFKIFTFPVEERSLIVAAIEG